MDFDRNSMTVPVQSSDYTKKFLQKDSNPTTMEVVTQTNAVKPSPCSARTRVRHSGTHGSTPGKNGLNTVCENVRMPDEPKEENAVCPKSETTPDSSRLCWKTT